MKYISLDIETTGLDPEKNQIVEVGAVLDEIGSTTPIEELPKFRAVLLHDEMTMGAYCANLHRDLWAEILVAKKWVRDTLGDNSGVGYFSRKRGKIGCEGDSIKDSPKSMLTHYCYPEMFETLFNVWLEEVWPDAIIDETLKTKINVAGKNPGTFDIPFLEALPGWQGMVAFHRRVLDPASHCIQPDDEHIPDLQECLKRCGLEGIVSHTAVDDAIDVIRIIRQQRVGETVYEALCRSCVMPDCRSRGNRITDCTSRSTRTAEESSCDKCYIEDVCSYLDGRSHDKPCHRFEPKD